MDETDTARTPNGVAAVVVTYRSDPSLLRALLAGLAPQVDLLIVVDNSESAPERAAVAAAAQGCRLLAAGRNEGVAGAQNRGIQAALDAGAGFVLLSDDDSDPPSDLVERLLGAIRQARSCGPRPAAVGPLAYDQRDPANLLVYRETRFGPRRVARTGLPASLLRVAFLLASGCLIDAAALREVGPMREDLFIDHVDLEWGLRARRAGWEVYALADLPMAHRLGDRLIRPRWLAGRTVHLHSPLRNYYLVRNTLLLIRGPLMPPGWRIGYLWWLVKLAAFNLLLVAPRRARATMLLRALRDGMLGRGGAAGFGSPRR